MEIIKIIVKQDNPDFYGELWYTESKQDNTREGLLWTFTRKAQAPDTALIEFYPLTATREIVDVFVKAHKDKLIDAVLDSVVNFVFQMHPATRHHT